MKSKIIFTVILLCLPCINFAQVTEEYLNYKNKVFSISFPGDSVKLITEKMMSMIYKYIDKFYDVKSVPSINILSFYSVVEPELSYDMLCGCILNRKGNEMMEPYGKAGIRIFSYLSADTIIKLLDYGISHRYELKNLTDRMLKESKYGIPKISSQEIQLALTFRLDKRKEVFIQNFDKKLKKWKRQKSHINRRQ